MTSARCVRTTRSRRLRPPILYAAIFAAGAAGIVLKAPFGHFLQHLMGKAPTGPRTPLEWLMSYEAQLGIVAVACVLHRYSGLPTVPKIEWLLSGAARRGPRPATWRPGLIAALISLLFFAISEIIQTYWGAPAPLAGRLSAGAIPHADMMKLVALWPLGVVGAGLSEEVVYRFGSLSVLMALMRMLRVGGRAANNDVAFWTANVLQAAWFGFGHVQQGLVAAQSGGPLLATAIAPQTWSALIFGVVYRRWGLEAAIIAHMASDILTPILVACWSGMHH